MVPWHTWKWTDKEEKVADCLNLGLQGQLEDPALDLVPRS